MSTARVIRMPAPDRPAAPPARRQSSAPSGLPPARRGAQLGFGWSLLLHGLIAAGWFAAPLLTPPPAKDRLADDIVAMLGARSVEQQTAGRPQPPAPATPPRPQPKEAVRAPAQRMLTQALASPVETAAEPAPAAAVAPPASPAGASAPGNADTSQQAQSAQAGPTEDDLIARFFRKLRRAVNARLSVPEEARQAGALGAPVVAFTVLADGTLQPGSLRLVKSGGHPALDEQALRTVREAAPFEPPPRPMPVTLDLDFARH